MSISNQKNFTAEEVSAMAKKIDPQLIFAIIEGELPDYADIQRALIDTYNYDYEPVDDIDDELSLVHDFAKNYLSNRTPFTATYDYCWMRGEGDGLWATLDFMLEHYAECFAKGALANIDWVDDCIELKKFED